MWPDERAVSAVAWNQNENQNCNQRQRFLSARFQHRCSFQHIFSTTSARFGRIFLQTRTKRAHGSHKTRTRLAQNAHTTRTKRAHGSHKTRTNWSGLNIQKSAPCDSWPYCLILYIMEYQFFRILKFYQFLPYRLLILSIESGRVSVRTICCMSESTGFQIVNWSYYAVRFQFGICAVRFGFSSVSVRYLCDPVRF